MDRNEGKRNEWGQKLIQNKHLSLELKKNFELKKANSNPKYPFMNHHHHNLHDRHNLFDDDATSSFVICSLKRRIKRLILSSEKKKVNL